MGPASLRWRFAPRSSRVVASVFAGSGIVADSVPSAEFEETCLKLCPMLSALGAA